MRYRNNNDFALIVYRQPYIGSAFTEKLSIGMECEGTVSQNSFLSCIVKGNNGWVELSKLTPLDATPPPIDPPPPTPDPSTETYTATITDTETGEVWSGILSKQ